MSPNAMRKFLRENNNVILNSVHDSSTLFQYCTSDSPAPSDIEHLPLLFTWDNKMGMGRFLFPDSFLAQVRSSTYTILPNTSSKDEEKIVQKMLPHQLHLILHPKWVQRITWPNLISTIDWNTKVAELIKDELNTSAVSRLTQTPNFFFSLPMSGQIYS